MIAGGGYDFYGLIGAALRLADTENLAKIQREWPGLHESLLEWKGKPVWGGDLDG